MRGESYYERTVSNVVKERYLPSVRGKILDAQRRRARRQPPGVQHLRDAEACSPTRRRPSSSACSACPTTRSRRSTSASRSVRSAIRRARSSSSRIRDAIAPRSSSRRQSRLPGVEVHHEPYRYYPQGDLAAHLVGYMTQMTAEEADRLTAQGYDTSDLVGRYGLESAWENYLRGKRGVEHYAVDARGQRLDNKTVADADPRRSASIEPVPGANLILTIDSDLQRLAEKSVEPRRGGRRRRRRGQDRPRAGDGQQAVVRSERDDRPPDARGVHAADAGPAQAVHRQDAARDLSAGLDLQVRHDVRRARGRPGRRGRDRCSAPA